MEKLDPMDRRLLMDLLAKKGKDDADIKAILKLLDKSGAVKPAHETRCWGLGDRICELRIDFEEGPAHAPPTPAPLAAASGSRAGA